MNREAAICKRFVSVDRRLLNNVVFLPTYQHSCVTHVNPCVAQVSQSEVQIDRKNPKNAFLAIEYLFSNYFRNLVTFSTCLF